jgi:hypothetical protein
MMLFPQKRFDEARQFGQGFAGCTSSASPTRQPSEVPRPSTLLRQQPYETRTMTEKAFNLQFVALIGNFSCCCAFENAPLLTMLWSQPIR